MLRSDAVEDQNATANALPQAPIATKAANIQTPAFLYAPLSQADPEIHRLVCAEAERQFRGLELIASENYTSAAVMAACGSLLTNKYSEGLPGARYYGGNEHVDAVERLAQSRALSLFGLDPAAWGVNVQPYSGSTANLAALTALLAPHERIMGLDLPSGGHLTHGYHTAKKRVSSTSIFWESLPYQVDASGAVDYARLAENARLFHPRLIICGASAYPREWDYARLRAIADENGAYLLADIAHIAGLVAAREAESPFEHCDIVTTTTHKTLRGPRAGLIFFRSALAEKVNAAVFPGTQGGPHNNTIAAIAVALGQAATPEFAAYASCVRANAAALSSSLIQRGHTIVSGGTVNHLLLWDLRPLRLTGSKLERVAELCAITLNKNCVPGDTSAVSPGGVRLGTPALTTRGMRPADMETVAEFLHRAVGIALRLQELPGCRMLREFVAAAERDADVAALRTDVEAFAIRFPMPGYPLAESL